MTYFLVVFDRDEGRVLKEVPFEDQGEALRERFRAERLHRHNRAIEVVVLGAASEADLRRTHARYFTSFGQLVARADASLTSSASGNASAAC